MDVTELDAEIFVGNGIPELWDEFVGQSVNGTFLHSHAFLASQIDSRQDVHIGVMRKGDLLAGIIFRKEGEVAVSHPRSTYGGVLYRKGLKVAHLITFIREMRDRLRMQGINNLNMRVVPTLFRSLPDESDLYALHSAGGRQVRSMVGTMINRDCYRPNALRRRQIRIAQRSKFQCDNEISATEAYNLIEGNLQAHGVRPVHSSLELACLAETFPNKVSIRGVRHESGDLVACTVLFTINNVLHTQYLASHPEERKRGALDLLIHQLWTDLRDGMQLSFGVSTEERGQHLNDGLSFYKESWGGFNYTAEDWIL